MEPILYNGQEIWATSFFDVATGHYVDRYFLRSDLEKVMSDPKTRKRWDEYIPKYDSIHQIEKHIDEEIDHD